MTTFLLIRHGDTDALGKLLAGSLPGWHLNDRGKQQAATLAGTLARLPIRAVYTSPLERAIETAAPIAAQHGLESRLLADLGEIRLGEWEGKTFSQLERLPRWKAFNTIRGSIRPPGGELMLECQARMLRQIECLVAEHPRETIAVVSHADPLRALLAHFLGIPLDLTARFEISPASLSIVHSADWGSRVVCLNRTEELAA